MWTEKVKNRNLNKNLDIPAKDGVRVFCVTKERISPLEWPAEGLFAFETGLELIKTTSPIMQLHIKGLHAVLSVRRKECEFAN